jgi:hypothetical protein
MNKIANKLEIFKNSYKELEWEYFSVRLLYSLARVRDSFRQEQPEKSLTITEEQKLKDRQ